MSTATRSLLLIIVSAALSSAGQTYLKLGLDAAGTGEARTLVSFARTAFGAWQVWLGLVLFASSVLIWMRVLSTSELSWGYPLLGLSYIFVAVLGRMVFQEHLGVSRIVGIAFVVIGAALVARS